MVKKINLFDKVLPSVNNEEYLDEIKDIDEAIRIALDTRKFEIDLYWKRTTYFWAFLVSAFGAYSFVCSIDQPIVEPAFDKNLLLVFVSSIGLLLSFCFYLVNRGSKYWQENWEDQIDILLKNRVGPIFQRVKNPNHKFINGKTKECFGLIESYPFSVSKVNTLLSLLMIFVWGTMFISSIFLFFKITVDYDINKGYCLCIIVLTLLFIYVLFSRSKGFAAHSVGVYDKKYKLLKKN